MLWIDFEGYGLGKGFGIPSRCEQMVTPVD